MENEKIEEGSFLNKNNPNVLPILALLLVVGLTIFVTGRCSLGANKDLDTKQLSSASVSSPGNDVGKNPPPNPSDEWIRTYGGNKGDFGEAIIKTSDGGYIAIGSADLGNRNSDFYVVKMDDKGDVTCPTCWQKTYGTTTHEYLNSIVEVDDGYVLAGFTSNSGQEDYLVIKITKLGDLQWQRTFGANDRREFGHRVIKTSDGGYAVIGGDVPIGAGVSRLWFIKLDSGGIKLWDKVYGNARGIDEIESGNLEETSYGYIIGSTTYVNKGGDFWVLKIDSSGNILKEVVIGKASPSNETLIDIHQTSDGGYITAGVTTDSSPGALTSGWAVKFSADLGVVWQKAYGLINTLTFSAEQEFRMVREVFDGYVFAGSILAPSVTTGVNNYDYWLVKTDFNGDTGYSNSFWQKTYGTPEQDHLEFMSLTPNGFVMAGWTQKPPKTSNNYDLMLIKIKGPGSFPCIVRTSLGLQAFVTNALTGGALSYALPTALSAMAGPISQTNANGIRADLCN